MLVISVIIPVYNSADTITACIESILNQSFTDFELIVVDDGSTDESGRICDELALSNARLKVVHQQNKGRTEARYVGVQMAKGEWVAFVDSDDTLPYDALSNLYDKTSQNTDIVLGNGYTLDNERRESIPMNDFRHMAIRADGIIGVPWGSLYRRSLLTHYLFDLPRKIINGEDYIFWLRLVFSTDKPVNIVYESVYNKGEEHTSNIFKWTAEYCYELNELRKTSIPSELREYYLHDILKDRLANLFAVSVCQSKKEWKKSKYYKEIITDLRNMNISLNLKQRLFLAIPSLKIRKFLSQFI